MYHIKFESQSYLSQTYVINITTSVMVLITTFRGVPRVGL